MNSGLAIVLAAFAAVAAPDRLPPIDQCLSDPSFVGYLSELLDAVRQQDRELLLAALADDILVDFGGGSGKAAFAATWALDRSPSSRVWDELGRALALGCASSGDAYVAPSAIAQLDSARAGFATLLAIVPGTQLRKEPRDDSEAVATLDWDLLTSSEQVASGEWLAVRLDDGRSGFVRRSQVRSPLDYRAVFEKRGERWLMTAFAAGADATALPFARRRSYSARQA